MRIVIDMQGAQTESRFRGIGRYTLSIAQAIAKNRGQHEIVLALNGLLTNTIEPIRATFDGLLPQKDIQVWYAPGPVRECEPINEQRRQIAEHIREAFITSLNPDVLLLSSLFEGYLDDAVTSISLSCSSIPTVVILYDLIPLLNWEIYLKPNPIYEKYYLNKIEFLKRANAWFAISDFSANEGKQLLGFDFKSVINVSTACDEIFKKVDIPFDYKNRLLRKFGIKKAFIMYSGGDDSRKNLPRLIHAYANLPHVIRSEYQLVLVGKFLQENVSALLDLGYSLKLIDQDLVFTGYVSDKELVEFYNLCHLFIFPSWHEGFGLPALEAMSCGAPVIGSKTSSLPEVIGCDEALFNPYSVEDINKKLVEVLCNEDFRINLSRHGFEQSKKFSWDNNAQLAIKAFEDIKDKNKSISSNAIEKNDRLTLAYISPLPPERTGIADYSSELLPSLSVYYNIFVIVEQKQCKIPSENKKYKTRSPEWLVENLKSIDRVIFHFGNSPFHQYMLPLIKKVSGVVVLHDFYLSNIFWNLEANGSSNNAWWHELYNSHGYKGLSDRFHYKDDGEIRLKYPSNLSILQAGQGIIVHSYFSKKLAKQWYGEDADCEWEVLELLRDSPQPISRDKARQQLSLRPDDFLVCSFGLLGPTKLNHRLLSAWLNSSLSQDRHCVLIFVGENHGGDYGKKLLKTIWDSGHPSKRIRITGWVPPSEFHSYLSAADLAVQLRTLSRGETSAAIFDCMNYGLATIVNANGSAAELPHDAVCMLPDEFEESQLIEAIENIWKNQQTRHLLSKNAQEVIQKKHTPDSCAKKYHEAIEKFYLKNASNLRPLISAIAKFAYGTEECIAIAESISQSISSKSLVPRLFIDLSATCRTDLKTGIERVVRALVLALIDSPSFGYRIETVFLSNENGRWCYRYARRYTLELLGVSELDLVDEIVEPQNGDILLTIDLSGYMLVDAEKSGLFIRYKELGVRIYSIIYDLLPILLPESFPQGADFSHQQWLKSIAKFDGAVCISRSVAKELYDWLKANNLNRLTPFKIGWFHLGYDLVNSAPSCGLPDDIENVVSQLSRQPTFIMVGTIEPRKGYLQALKAFTQLWHNGLDINLVIIGREGWKELPDNMRRTIPEIIIQLRQHPELGKRLIWLEGISDECLEKIYSISTCLIAASDGEGFGLPLIEAAQHHLPIIARDIPVFREVVGEYAYLFKGGNPKHLAAAIKDWLVLFKNGKISNRALQLATWKESAKALLSVVISDKWLYKFVEKSIIRKAIDQHLLLIHAARVKMISNILPSGQIILDLGGANCPLYKMGYPYRFKKLILIDLPPEDRHDYYKEVVIDPNCEGGEVVIQYGDMTELDTFRDESADFVWSGQSIEHITRKAGEKMCQAAFRVLKKGGAFCLDTPNRKLTKIHLRGSNEKFIHPEHCIEYYPEQLEQLLLSTGFEIKQKLGICDMPNTLATDEFCYEDFMYGRQITDQVDNGYIQFFHCIKP